MNSIKTESAIIFNCMKFLFGVLKKYNLAKMCAYPPPVSTKCVPVTNTRVRCGCIVLKDFMAIVPDCFHVRHYINLCYST